MKRLLAGLLLLGACRHEPAAGPVAPCPEPPRVFTYEEMEDFFRRRDECQDDACRDAVTAEAKGVLISVPTLTLAANEAAERSSSGDLPVEELEVIKQHACACADPACAEKVQVEFEAWADKWADAKGSQAQADAAGKLAEEISECMVKAMTAGGSAP